MSRFRIKEFYRGSGVQYSFVLDGIIRMPGSDESAVPTDQDKVGQPVVKITSPANNSTYSWNALVNYSVVVSWQGKSTNIRRFLRTKS